MPAPHLPGRPQTIPGTLFFVSYSSPAHLLPSVSNWLPFGAAGLCTIPDLVYFQWLSQSNKSSGHVLFPFLTLHGCLSPPLLWQSSPRPLLGTHLLTPFAFRWPFLLTLTLPGHKSSQHICVLLCKLQTYSNRLLPLVLTITLLKQRGVGLLAPKIHGSSKTLTDTLQSKH